MEVPQSKVRMDWDRVQTAVVAASVRANANRISAAGDTVELLDCFNDDTHQGRYVVQGLVPLTARDELLRAMPSDMVDDFYRHQARLAAANPADVRVASCCSNKKIDPDTGRVVCVTPGDRQILLDPIVSDALTLSFAKYADRAEQKGSGHDAVVVYGTLAVFVVLLFVLPVVIGRK